MSKKKNKTPAAEKTEETVETVQTAEDGLSAADEPQCEAPDAPPAESEVSTEEPAEENETPEEPEKPEKVPSHKKKSKAGRVILTVLLSLAAVAAMLAAAGAIWANKAFEPVFTEIGEEADLSSLGDTKLKKLFAKVVPGQTVDTSSLGERSVTVKMFGMFDKVIPVTVRDTVPPEFEVKNVELVAGISLEAKDFVFSCEDLTDVTFSFDGNVPSFDKVGDYDVVIRAEDEGGNSAVRDSHLTVSDVSLELNVEFGTDAEGIAEQLKKEHPEFRTADLDLIDAGSVGSCRASALSDDTYYLFNINIRDTTPPKAETHSFDIRLGEKVEKDSFITDVEDKSPVTVTFEKDPVFDKTGTQKLKVTLADDQGNETVCTPELRIHDFTDEVTVEAGVSASALKKELFPNGEDSTLDFELVFEPSALALGENKVKLKGAYNDFEVKVNVKDTFAPTLVLHDVSVLVNQNVTPGMFVSSCADATAVSYAFADSVSSSAGGTFDVKVVAADAAGNKTTRTAKLTVIVDTEPPVIRGLNTLNVTTGENVLLKSGVSATDNVDGEIQFSVDSSALNTSVEGYYTVYYSATDSSGNTAREARTVIVSGIGAETINRLCDNVLQYIVNNSMTDRQKAYAIYNWVTSNFRYSTSTAYLMGQYYKAAYSGFNTHAGNCYIYYAVSSALLTRAGVQNIMIQRNEPSNPHYWSLVNIGGSWYHFDTCPHFAAYPFNSFLRTDAEVRWYSQTQAIGYYNFDSSLYPATP